MTPALLTSGEVAAESRVHPLIGAEIQLIAPPPRRRPRLLTVDTTKHSIPLPFQQKTFCQKRKSNQMKQNKKRGL